MNFATLEELRQFLTANPEIQVLELLMPDLSGILRAKRIHLSEFERLFNGSFLTPRSAPLLGIRGDWYDDIPLTELGGDPDQIIRPVAGTLAVVPWYDSPVAQVVVAYTQDDGALDWVDARQPLQSVLACLEKAGLSATVTTELEFYLLANTDDNRPAPLRGNIPGTAMQQEGIQYSRKHGFGATFMAKPFTDIAGSGMHIHTSIYDRDGVNVFADPDPIDPPRLMPRLRHAVAGLGALLDESMLCLAPHPNSYRRFRAGALAPSGRSWGYDHREVALRVPRSSEHNRRIEHRVAGADANPYLALATVLAGIHYGLEQQLLPGDPIPREADLSTDETTLPKRLDAAIALFANSEVLSTYLGSAFTAVYTAMRQGESNAYHAQVPDVDYAWYLRAL